MKNSRFNLVLVVIFFISAVTITRLFFIQVMKGDFHKALAQGQQKLITSIQGQRGEIFLTNGENIIPLATNKTWFFCYIVPTEIENKEEAAQALSEILSIDGDRIFEKMQQENFFALLKHKLTDQEIKTLKEFKIEGVYLKEEKLRDYPLGNFASHITGFVGGEEEGQYGVEGFYNDILEGKENFIEGQRSFGSLIFLNAKNLLNQEGSDIYLTIDYKVQSMAEKLLKEGKERFGFEEGQIIVMDPYSGKIITLASFPNFDPNYYFEEENLEVFKNPVLQKIFEPGSVFKPFIMAAALEQGKITPQTKYVDEGFVEINRRFIYNYQREKWGERTMTEVLEKSINTGAIFVLNQIGNESFLEYIERFGFFEKTGIDSQGEEVYSQKGVFEKGKDIDFATATFGQGIAMTPIQLMRGWAAIANGGRLVKPYLVEKIVENGKEIKVEPEISESLIISPRTSSQLTAMLISVVENGFGQTARIPGYFVAGKTGTSQVPFSVLGIDKKGYSDKTIQTFIGYAPANPKFLILVKLNDPGTRTAGYSAGIIFEELAKYIIDLWQIPPDY